MSAIVNVGTLEGLLRWKADDAELQKSLTDVAKKADVSKTQLNRYNKELDSVNAAYKRVAAALDPVVAKTQKYEKQVDAITRALKAGIISQEQYNKDLSLAKQHFDDASAGAQKHSSVLGGLSGSILAAGAAYLSFQAIISTVQRILSGAIDEAKEAAATHALLTAAVKSTGGAAGFTAAELENLAGAWSTQLGIDDEAIAGALKIQLEYSRIGHEVFPRTARAAIDMAASQGKAIKSTDDLAEAFRKADKLVADPARAIKLFAREGKALEEQQIRNIQQFLKQNDLIGAQNIVLAELERRYGGSALALRHELGGSIQAVDVAWKNILEELGKGIFFDLTGVDSLSDKLTDPELLQSAHDLGVSLGIIAGWLIHIVSLAKPIAAILDGFTNLLSFQGIRGGPVPDEEQPGFVGPPAPVGFTPGSFSPPTPPIKPPDLAAMGRAASEAERLAKAYKEAREHALATIDDLIRQAEQAARVAKVSVAGPIAVKNELLAIKIEEKIISEEKKLQEKTGNKLLQLYDWQKEKIKEAITLEAEFTKQTAINLEIDQQKHKTKTDIGRAEAEIQDIINGSTKATEAYTIQLEKQAIADRLLLDLADPRLDAIRAEIDSRVEQLAGRKLIAAENKHARDFALDLASAETDLRDAITGSTDESREAAIQFDIKSRLLEACTNAESDLGKSIAETTRHEHERLDTMKDVIEAAKQIQSLDNEASLQTAISRIDTSQSNYLQQIEEQYLQTIAAIGHGSIEEGERIIDETQRVLESFGFDIGDLSQKIKDDLKALQDAEISKTVAGASKTPFDVYKQERDRIEEYISDSTKRTTQQVKDAQAYLTQLDEKYWSDQLSIWSSALDELAGLFGGALGGMLQKIRSWINQIQQVMEAMQSLKVASGGFDSSALGAAFTKYGTYAAYGFLAWVGLKIYEGWTKARTKFGEASLGGGTSGDRRIADQISQTITDLTQQVSDLAVQWHLGLVSLTRGSVTIRANSDGSIIVKSLIDNVGRVFKTMTEALDYAKVQALKFATFSEQTSELVRAAILKSRATTSEGLQADIDFANRLATQNLTELESQFHSFLQTFVEDFRHLMTLFGPGQLRSLGDFTQLGTAAESAITGLLGGIQGMYDQLTGHKVDQDAIDERNRVAFNAQRAIVTAQLILLYEEVKARIAEYQVRLRILQSGVLGGNGGGQVDRSGRSDITGSVYSRADITKGGGVLLQDNRNPSGDGGLAALLQVLDNLARAMQGLPPEIKPGGIRHGAGRGGGGAGATRDSVRSFIDDRSFQLSLVGLDDFHQKLAQITRDYAPQLAAAGKDKKLREQLLALQQQETTAAIKAHDEEVAARQADLRTQFTQLVAPDAFEQATRQFEDMKKEIEKAGFGADETAKMIAGLTAAESDAIQKLADQQFASLVGELSNVVADSETNAEQHKLHNELLRAQEIINYQMKMIELRAEYQLLRAKGVLTQQEITLLDKVFGWIDAHANVLPGGADWVPSFEQVSTAASDISQAASNQSDAADKLRSAVESLIDYQTSLHTDSSLGLVDPRTALDNSKADYEENRRKALAGDVDAIAHFKDFAETYRRNLIAFSPSSELTASILAGIDETINSIRGSRAVQAALSSDGQAIVTGLSSVSSGVAMVHAVATAVNDNTTAAKDSLAALTPDSIAEAAKAKQADYLSATLTAQQSSAASLKLVSDGLTALASNVLAWRTESRANTDEAYQQLTEANVELAKIANNTKHPKKLAGTGG